MKRFALILWISCLLGRQAAAVVLVTYAEAPNDNLSSLSGTEVFDFNDLNTGLNTDVAWDGVGTFDKLFIKSADAYGGATDATHPNGTKYSVQGAGTSVSSTTLTLDTGSSYFGMWWSAGDPLNVLSFYSGDSLIGTFTTANLMNLLPDSYDGNPKNRSINGGEPYAFINFFGEVGTMWDRIVLTNNGSSGFESDNYTSRVAAWDPAIDGPLPGVPVAVLDGGTSTPVTSESLTGSRWAQTAGSIPAAPLPPWTLLVAFAAVVGLRSLPNCQPRS